MKKMTILYNVFLYLAIFSGLIYAWKDVRAYGIFYKVLLIFTFLFAIIIEYNKRKH